ncbi:MAG TPA: proline--tRNA ligase [Candidatus Baltobacteraceae bacterium]
MLIPERLLMKEADHVAGFAPEVAWVTHGGTEELTERLAIRPTSEVIVGTMYAQWIESYRDLPILINQWANVVRWEKATRPFLRTMEFLWQEGHTAHATAEQAREEALRMLDVYEEFSRNVAAIPVYKGVKSAGERFPGALETFSIEALMPDGKALQSATSHDLGQNFAKAYDITFADADQAIKHVFTTSWGMSWRMLGAVIMLHGDDRGLQIPPKLAPVEAVFVPIVRGGDDRPVVKAKELAAQLRAQGRRVKVDDRDQSPGWKYAEWEMRGVPLRVEIGPKDLESSSVMLVRRDKNKGEEGAKVAVGFDALAGAIADALDAIHASMLAKAEEHLTQHTFHVTQAPDFFERCANRDGMIDIAWCGRSECEADVQARTGATTRNTRPLQAGDSTCVACGEPARVRAYFAQSY